MNVHETPEGLFTEASVEPSSFFSGELVSKDPTSSLEACWWLVFTILLFCSPAIVWAVWARCT